MVVGFEQPRFVTCATLSSCSRTAASIFGWRWPWMLHQRLLRAVDVAAAVDVDQLAAFGPLDHKRLVLGHLREGVPDDRAIPIAQSVAVLCIL